MVMTSAYYADRTDSRGGGRESEVSPSREEDVKAELKFCTIC